MILQGPLPANVMQSRALEGSRILSKKLRASSEAWGVTQHTERLKLHQKGSVSQLPACDRPFTAAHGLGMRPILCSSTHGSPQCNLYRVNYCLLKMRGKEGKPWEGGEGSTLKQEGEDVDIAQLKK